MRIINAQFENLQKVRKFKFHYQNRQVEDAHIKRLRKTLFKDGIWNTMAPVIVNILTMNILDGQHRWSLYLQLVDEGLIDPTQTMLWVEYVNMDPTEEHRYITELQEANHWDNEDFCESYVKGGDPYYISAKNFCDTHPLCNSVNKAGKVSSRAYRLANIMLTGDRNEKHLRDGQLSFTKKEEKEADIIHGELLKILKALKINPTIGKSGLEGLASAWRVLRRDGHPMKEWIKELSKDKYEYGPKTNKTWGVNVWNEFLAPVALKLLRKSQGISS